MERFNGWVRSCRAFAAGAMVMGLVATVYVAFAQEVAAPTVPATGFDLKGLISGLLLTALTALAGLLVKALTGLLNKAGTRVDAWLEAKIGNDTLSHGLTVVEHLAFQVAAELIQQGVPTLLKALEDGKIDKAEMAGLRALVMEKMDDLLPQNVYDALKAQGVNVESLAGAAVEAALVKLKLAQPKGETAGPKVG